MPVKITDNSAAFLSAVRQGVIKALDNAGKAGVATSVPMTPVVTGWAQASEHHLVVDEQGNWVAGNTEDGNGEWLPAFDGNGMLTCYVGSQTALRPDMQGQGYFEYIELGTRGRTGYGMFAAGFAAAEAAVLPALEQNTP